MPEFIDDTLDQDTIHEETVTTDDTLAQAIANAKKCQTSIITLDGEQVEGLIGTCVSLLQSENVENVVYKVTAEGEMAFEADLQLSQGTRIIIRAICLKEDKKPCEIPETATPLVDIVVGDYEFKPVGDTLIYTEPFENGEIQIHFVDGDGTLEILYQGESLGTIRKGQDASLNVENHVLNIKAKIDQALGITPEIEKLEKQAEIFAETAVPKPYTNEGCNAVVMGSDALKILPMLFMIMMSLKLRGLPNRTKDLIASATLQFTSRLLRALELLKMSK